MKWNIEGLALLYRPDVFTGSFDNELMQERHEREVQRKLAALKEAIAQESDPLEAMKKLNSKDHLQFFHNNLQFFQEEKVLEKAVLYLYGKLNAPFSSGGNAAEWNTLFNLCDRQRLAELGSPVSFPTATVYRGSVSGCKRSLSWTPDAKRAGQLAARWQDPNLGGGEIYEVDITREDVLVYIKRSREDEIILSPSFIKDAAIRPHIP